MKRLISLFLVFSLVSTQLLAYDPAGFQSEVDEGIETFQTNNFSVESLKTERMSEKKFNQTKAKILKVYNKEYKKVAKKSEKRQLKGILRKLKNRFKLLRKSSKKLSDKQVAKIAKIKNSSPAEVKESLS